MPTTEPDIKVPGWTRVAVGALSACIIAVVATQTYFDQRFVAKSEHEEHERSDRAEVSRIDRTLLSHMENTRLDSTRLSVIEAQLATIQRQLERMDGKLDKAAKSPSRAHP
jgi:hypothetical protein